MSVLTEAFGTIINVGYPGMVESDGTLPHLVPP
jgi:hypothetical protein